MLLLEIVPQPNWILLINPPRVHAAIGRINHTNNPISARRGACLSITPTPFYKDDPSVPSRSNRRRNKKEKPGATTGGFRLKTQLVVAQFDQQVGHSLPDTPGKLRAISHLVEEICPCFCLQEMRQL